MNLAPLNFVILSLVLFVFSAPAQESVREKEGPKAEPMKRVEEWPNRFAECDMNKLEATAMASFSPDGKLLVTADMEGKSLQLLDADTGRRLRVCDPKAQQIIGLSFTRDGKRLKLRLADPDHRWQRGGIGVFDLSTERLLWQAMEGGKAEHNTNAATDVSPDDCHAAVADKQGGIHLRDLNTGRIVKTLKGHNRRVSYVLFSQDGKRLLSASLRDQACLWDVGTGAMIAQRPTKGYREVRPGFLCDQTPVIEAGHPNSLAVDVINMETGKRLNDSDKIDHRLNRKLIPQRVSGFEDGQAREFMRPVSGDSKAALTIIGGPCLAAYVLLTSGKTDPIVIAGGDLSQCGFTPDSRWAFAVVSEDDTVAVNERKRSCMFWSAASGAVQARVQPPDGAWGLHFSPDGKKAAIVGNDSLWLWRNVDRLLK